MPEILSNPFFVNSLVAGVIISILAGIIGVFILLYRNTFVVGGIAHIAFGGVGLAYLINVPIVWGAMAFSVAAALLLSAPNQEYVKEHNTLIGILWALGMSLGIVFISLKPGYVPDLKGYLFGNILLVSELNVIVSAVILVLVLLSILLFGKEFILIAFDPKFCQARRLPVKTLIVLFNILTALTLVSIVSVAGIILVIAMMTLSPFISSYLVRSIKSTILLSILLNITFVLLGLLISYYFNIPSGPAIVLPEGILLVVVVGIKKFVLSYQSTD